MPKLDGPLSKHQKYFLQSRGFGKNPSSSHLKSAPGSGVVGGGGVVVRAVEYWTASLGGLWVVLRRVVRRVPESFESSFTLFVFAAVLVRLRDRGGFFFVLDGAATSFSVPLHSARNGKIVFVSVTISVETFFCIDNLSGNLPVYL